MRKKSSSSEDKSVLGRVKEMICPVSRRDRRKLETRDRIYLAALRLLSEHDFDTVTVEMITEAADVGKGTFFNYFSSKEAIVSSYFESQIQQLTETLKAVSSGSPTDEWPADKEYESAEGGPFWQKMVAIVHHSAERRDKNKHFTRTLLSLALTNPQVRAANLLFRQRLVEVIRGLIEEAQRQGELRRDVTADSLAEFMFGTHLAALYVWSQSETEEGLHHALDRAYARVWSGIRNIE